VERSTSGGDAARWRAWVWLFPATYLVHIVEEFLAAEGFPAWVSRHAGFDVTVTEFLLVNAVALALMSICSVLVLRRPSFLWLGVTVGAIAEVNGALHLAASLVTRSYSPGVVSGTVLWIPLGALAIYVGGRFLRPRIFWAAVVAGLAVQGLVVVVARGGL
jgi:hypothetical protein